MSYPCTRCLKAVKTYCQVRVLGNTITPAKQEMLVTWKEATSYGRLSYGRAKAMCKVCPLSFTNVEHLISFLCMNRDCKEAWAVLDRPAEEVREVFAYLLPTNKLV